MDITTQSKVCTRCGGTPQPISNFSKIKLKSGKSSTSSWCKSCKVMAAEEWRKANPERHRVNQRTWDSRHPEKRLRQSARDLGFDPDWMLRYYEDHAGQCDICGKLPASRFKRLHIDHDHITGEFRGLLCHRCNLGIGYFGDDVKFLRRAISYLSKTERVQPPSVRSAKMTFWATRSEETDYAGNPRIDVHVTYGPVTIKVNEEPGHLANFHKELGRLLEEIKGGK